MTHWWMASLNSLEIAVWISFIKKCMQLSLPSAVWGTLWNNSENSFFFLVWILSFGCIFYEARVWLLVAISSQQPLCWHAFLKQMPVTYSRVKLGLQDIAMTAFYKGCWNYFSNFILAPWVRPLMMVLAFSHILLLQKRLFHTGRG